MINVLDIFSHLQINSNEIFKGCLEIIKKVGNSTVSHKAYKIHRVLFFYVSTSKLIFAFFISQNYRKFFNYVT